MTEPALKELLETKIDAQRALQDERDRRYAEVNVEREKALRIKEEGDAKALNLAREIQQYKDEKANELREQINRERLLYATKEDIHRLEVALKPLAEFMATQTGQSKGAIDSRTVVFAVITVMLTAGALVTAVMK